MVFVRRLLLGLIALTAVVRAVAYLLHAAAYLGTPLEAYHLEAKMVLLAYRVQLGATLYPRWDHYPHVANFYGPVYFALVGLAGRAAHADIPALFQIGRAVTFVATLGTTLLVGCVATRHYGRTAGAVGAVTTLGPSLMVGITLMVRPDALADLLGLGGFLLAGARPRTATLAGGALLVLAILTKQTCALYLAAAVLDLVREGRRGAAGGLLAGCAAALAAIVTGVNARVEPNFVASLLGDSHTPWNTRFLAQTTLQVLRTSPDVFMLPAIGIGLWLTSDRRNARFATRGLVLLGGSFIATGKCGAGMNYYLGLRAVEGLAAGALWQAVGAATGGARAALLASCALVEASLLPSTAIQFYGAYRGGQEHAYQATPQGREILRGERELLNKARDPSIHILTDWGMLDLYQGERAAFGDPFLFRLMVLTGRIDPVVMQRRIDDQYYDVVVTTSDIMSPRYPDSDIGRGDFGLPKVLADRVRKRYVRKAAAAGLFFYWPRDRSAGDGTPVAPRAGSW